MNLTFPILFSHKFTQGTATLTSLPHLHRGFKWVHAIYHASHNKNSMCGYLSLYTLPLEAVTTAQKQKYIKMYLHSIFRWPHHRYQNGHYTGKGHNNRHMGQSGNDSNRGHNPHMRGPCKVVDTGTAPLPLPYWCSDYSPPVQCLVTHSPI
jgi:hypothetical protein